MRLVAGGGMISREYKRDRMRAPWRPPGRIVQSSALARWTRTRVREMEYVAARTIALGEFEFARAEIRIAAAGVDRDALLEQAHGIAAEWLARQEASITGVPREDQPYGPLIGVRRSVGIGYGMTLRGEGKRETVKFDVFAMEPITDDRNFGATLDLLMSWVEVRAREERDAVRGGKPDEGI